MKKIYITILLALFGVMAIASSASAATLQFTPTVFNVSAGESFNMVVSLNPEATKNYVTKLEISFPANILSVSSFTLGSSWTAISMPEYNVTDNTNGILVRGAGFPGGTSGPVTFGTITFTAKNGGSGTVTMNTANSLSLGGAGQNLLIGSAEASVNVTAVAGATTVTPPPSTAGQTSQTATPGSDGQITPEAAATGSASEDTAPAITEIDLTDTTLNPAPAGLLTGAMNVLSLGTGKTWLSWLILLIIIIAIIYGIGYYMKRNNGNQIKTN